MSFNKRSWRGDKFSERIGNQGKDVDIGDTATYFRDSEGRTINISPSYGLQVEDSQGTVIHDTPDCVIATGMNYGGHVYFADAGGALGSITDGGSDGSSTYSGGPTVDNMSIAGDIPADLTNVQGAYIKVRSWIRIPATKVSSDSYYECHIRFSNTYNSTAGAYRNNILGRKQYSQSHDADDLRMEEETSVNAIVPVVYNGDDPYLTFVTNSDFYGMTTQVAQYFHANYIDIQGFLV